jgi:hypothetical protein
MMSAVLATLSNLKRKRHHAYHPDLVVYY